MYVTQEVGVSQEAAILGSGCVAGRGHHREWVCHILPILASFPRRWKVEQQTAGFTATHGNCTTAVSFKPFRVDFLVYKELAVSVNARGLLNFEHYREKK